MDKVETMLKDWSHNFQVLEKEDKVAKQKRILVGRYIREPFADGYAYYKIIKETKSKIQIKVVKGIGDDWTIPYWGEETTIDKKYALQNIIRRDRLEKLFGRR